MEKRAKFSIDALLDNSCSLSPIAKAARWPIHAQSTAPSLQEPVHPVWGWTPELCAEQSYLSRCTTARNQHDVYTSSLLPGAPLPSDSFTFIINY